jgi:hypothetical protein
MPANRIGAIAAFAVGLFIQPGSAAACSVSGNYNRPVEERIAGRDDLRRVTGTYRIERIDLQTTYLGDMPIHGRLTTLRGTGFAIVQPYNPVWVECLIYYLPMGDAAGTFYISRRARDGEYELVDWSGHYVVGMAVLPRDD